MARVLALVEGPTERNFGQRVLAAHLAIHSVEYHPRVIGKPGHKGGNNWEKAKKEISSHIKNPKIDLVTTMFDLQGLPLSWPGRAEALSKGLRHRDAASFIEHRIAEAISIEVAGSRVSKRFDPHLTVHEFEALLFSSPMMLAETMGANEMSAALQSILDAFGDCELINDHADTKPSARIRHLFPAYEKVVDGTEAAERIGLELIRANCRHFNSWLSRLE